MMTAGLACLVLGQELTFGKFHSRQEFADAMHRIHSASFGAHSQTKAEILAELGPPDDIVQAGDAIPGQRWHNETWSYGTNGHHSFATLGSVTFEGDNLKDFKYSPKPPSPQLISEKELRDLLRKIYRPVNRRRLQGGENYNVNDPLELIRVSNLLIPLGVEKAAAVLGEFQRLDPDTWPRFDFPHWISRAMFRGKKPGYIFPSPRIGQIIPKPPIELSNWSNFPVLNLSGLPIPVVWDSVGDGEPLAFYRYASANIKDWDVIDGKLIPPNDPFPLYREVLAMKPFPVDDDYNRRKLLIAAGIIRAVRNALPARDSEWSDWTNEGVVDEEKFEALHKRFLHLKCRWDVRLGMYVRGDGTYDADSNPSPQVQTPRKGSI